MKATLYRAIGLAALGISSQSYAQETQSQVIPEWKVADRFRLFDKANTDAREQVDGLLDEIEKQPDAHLRTFHGEILNTLSGVDGASSHSESLRKSNYVPSGDEAPRTSGRYAESYLYPEHYSIEIRMPDDPQAEFVCTYRSAIEEVNGDCSRWTKLRIDTGRAASKNNWRIQGEVEFVDAKQQTGSLKIEFKDNLVVALGDSFISGEGNPDVPSLISNEPSSDFKRPSWGGEAEAYKEVVRPAEWWDEPCHRSLLSWPVLSGVGHAARNPQQALTLVHLGCSGAIARDIFERGETSLPGGGDEKTSQLAQLDKLMTRPDRDWGKRNVDSVLLSIGGNDIGFAPVLATLTLPPNGYTLGPLLARLVGDKAGAVCPYKNTGKPLSRLCEKKRSAEERLEGLQTEFQLLDDAFKRKLPTAQIFHTTYPNPLVSMNGTACDTNPLNDRPKVNRKGVPSGFEGLMGTLPKISRGFRFKSWNFELHYLPESHIDQMLIPGSKILCDTTPEPTDSEICQTLWVHSNLNKKIVGNSLWTPVTSHTNEIDGNGICRAGSGGQSRYLPVAAALDGSKQLVWKNGKAPRDYNPYDKDSPRWFRLPNDSILTQFGFYNEEPSFHHGTAHPTFNAHLSYAQAMLETGLVERNKNEEKVVIRIRI